MKLFGKPGACSLAAHIVLRECGLDFTLVNVDLRSKQTERGEDYLLINSKGKVPALQLDDGSVLTEAAVIMHYLADSKADRMLLAPAGSLTRYHTLEWLNYIATELHKGFNPLFQPDTPAAYQMQLRAQLEARFRYVDEQLREKQWLMGLRFSIADAYLFVVTRWARAVQLDISQLSALESWFLRVAQRPAVIAALQAEGLALPV
ncbi:glutathione transferase GstA [Erwinia sp. V71]|uniref:glutathione transferase GstA n=1 Tax=Erwinia sp. V71 TaxID=3369424 RepID=UPI003F60996C